jgi:16S rRNA (adenine1518-N6/adenine1519-N6)-dimethyltransferase
MVTGPVSSLGERDPTEKVLVGLLGPADVRSLAAEIDLRPSKRRGQNFVIEPNTIRRILRIANLTEHDVVVEVGPGLGSLTVGLLQVAARVVAVEIDKRMAALLPDTVRTRLPGATGRLEVVADDVLRIDRVPGPPPTALVANLPYNVGVPVLLHLLAVMPTIRSALIMVQAEVADRLVASPSSRTYGTPTVKTAWFGQALPAGLVGRRVFWPVPHVDSRLVAWERHPCPGRERDRAAVFAVIDAAFSQRRKTLRTAVSGIAGGAATATQALLAAGIDPGARGETLRIDDFVRLTEALGHIDMRDDLPS